MDYSDTHWFSLQRSMGDNYYKIFNYVCPDNPTALPSWYKPCLNKYLEGKWELLDVYGNSLNPQTFWTFTRSKGSNDPLRGVDQIRCTGACNTLLGEPFAYVEHSEFTGGIVILYTRMERDSVDKVKKCEIITPDEKKMQSRLFTETEQKFLEKRLRGIKETPLFLSTSMITYIIIN